MDAVSTEVAVQTPPPSPPAVDLEIPATTTKLVREAQTWPDRARAVRIVDSRTYEVAADMLLGIKALRTQIGADLDPLIKSAYEHHRDLVAFKRKSDDPLAEAEGIIKGGLKTYDEEQERLRQEEERRLQEIARKEAEDRALAEAAALEREAVESGDPSLLFEAHALVDEPVVAPVVQLARSTPKVAGISYKEAYRAEVTDLLALVRYVAQHPEHLALLQANTTALNGMARSMKDGLKLPGVRVIKDRIVAAGSRR